MNNTMIKQVLIFAAGAVAGSLATFVAMRNKCEKRIQDEVDSVKKALYEDDEPTDVPDEQDGKIYSGHIEPSTDDEESEEHDIFKSIVRGQGYSSSLEQTANAVKVSVKKDTYPPEIIPPEEYGEIEEYDQLEYTYFADCVVVDSDGDIVDGDEVEDTIGFESLNHFGDYESDSVFIKNDVRHAYYAVYKDLRKYSDVQKLNSKPRRTEV